MATFTYTRSQPVATDLLSVSQPILTQNTNSSDSIFGIEHFAFSNTTSNQGLHQTVTTPNYTSDPPTTVNPVFYGKAPTSPVGIIQYSRGVSNAVPTPLTTIQSPASPITLAPSAFVNMLDFAGLTFASFNCYITTVSSPNPAVTSVSLVTWNGSVFTPLSTFGFGLRNSSSGLQLFNGTSTTITGIFWTIEFIRISP